MERLIPARRYMVASFCDNPIRFLFGVKGRNASEARRNIRAFVGAWGARTVRFSDDRVTVVFDGGAQVKFFYMKRHG
jgi:hypothetical protein